MGNKVLFYRLVYLPQINYDCFTEANLAEFDNLEIQQ